MTKPPHRSSPNNQMALLPSIIGEIVTQRMYTENNLALRQGKISGYVTDFC